MGLIPVSEKFGVKIRDSAHPAIKNEHDFDLSSTVQQSTSEHVVGFRDDSVKCF